MKSFTLVEALIMIFVFALAIGATSGFILMAYRTHGYEWEQSLAVEEARRGIEIMAKEIRKSRQGENGSYPIEYAGDREFVFYSDVDGDGKTEKVRYFLGQVSSGTQTQKCVTFSAGGSCSVNFSNFLTGSLKSAQVGVSAEGDLGSGSEYVEIFADGTKLGNVCQTGCTDCAGTWQGTANFDVTTQAQDDNINFLADATFSVNANCSWEEPNHKMKANFEFSFTQEILGTELKKGVIEPVFSTSGQVTYPQESENVSIITSYIRNPPPIFEYFDQSGNKIEQYPARLTDTKLMKVFLVINIDPNRPPTEYQLGTFVQLRNLKQE